MAEIIKKYKISKIEANNQKRVLKQIKKIKEVKSATIDKAESILKLELMMDENEKRIPSKLLKLEEAIKKAILKYEDSASIEPITYVAQYRKVLYLNGLDCGHCATKVETLAKKKLNYDKLLVDFASLRFIIESSDKEQMENIIDLVSEIAHKVDENIVVTEQVIKNETNKKEIKKLFTIKRLSYILGFVVFVIAILCFINFDINKISRILDLLAHKEADVHFSSNKFDTTYKILLLVTYGLIGYPVIFKFIRNIFNKRFFDESTLMVLASLGAICTNHYIEAIMVLTLFQFGEFLQHLAVNKCRKSIEELLKFDIKFAKLKKNDEIVELEVESIIPDDVIVVNKGEMIPLDGELLNNKGMVDTKNVTGESMVRELSRGDVVMAGTVNMGNVIEVKVIRPYSESMIAKIIDMVENASTSKAKAEHFITKFSKLYTPIILILALVIGVLGYFIDTRFFMNNFSRELYVDLKIQEWIYRAMVFLVISCPCALVISIPLCFFTGIGVSSKRGILIKGSNYLETLNDVGTIVFDKTGTLTKGEFKLRKVVPFNDQKEESVIRTLMYAEYYSNHPIGMSIVDDYGRDKILPDIISDFANLSGGAKALINGNKVIVGNYKLMQNLKIEVPHVEEAGLVIYVIKEKVCLGYVVIGDSVKDEAKNAICALKDYGIKKTYILTGDSAWIAKETAESVNIDEYYANLLPDQKVEILKEIKEKNKEFGKVVFVGDGINDAPVIATSDVGIAMGHAGSDATIAVSDVVIMSDDLNRLPDIIKVAKATRKKVMQNIFISLSIKVIIAILSINPYIPVPLWLAIFSDVGVSLIAILNSILILSTFKEKEAKK